MSDFSTLFATIDRSAPWLEPYAHIHHAFSECKHTGELADWLNDYFAKNHIAPALYGTNRPLYFVSQDDLPHGTAYERHIFATAHIPTRNNLHDWFGACIWSVFPKSKAILNHVHLREMANNGDKGLRNRVRDAITVFDENGAILVVSDENIGKSLRDFDWHNALVAPRRFWCNPTQPKDDDKAQAFIFGHALLEQLINPRKPLCSHTWIIKVGDDFFAKSLTEKLTDLDDRLSKELGDWLVDGATPKDLSPLPILGVPFFWDNASLSFYEDEFVFRRGRKA